uniref:Uncharacterized protein n=1 Tax=Parastrongyloides trichosuri TaxID=131310 RepID=A0A0N4Z470_PARTI
MTIKILLFSLIIQLILNLVSPAPTVYINGQPFSRIRDQLTQPIFEGVYYDGSSYGDIKYTDKPAQVNSNNKNHNYHFTDSPFRILSSDFYIRLNGGSYDCKMDEIISKCGLIPLYSYKDSRYQNSLMYVTSDLDVPVVDRNKKITLVGYVAKEQRCGAKVEVDKIVVNYRNPYTRLIPHSAVTQQYGPNYMYFNEPYIQKTKGFFYAWEPIGNTKSFQAMRQDKVNGDNTLVDGGVSPQSIVCLGNRIGG